jgi:hypothetical protein
MTQFQLELMFPTGPAIGLQRDLLKKSPKYTGRTKLRETKLKKQRKSEFPKRPASLLHRIDSRTTGNCLRRSCSTSCVSQRAAAFPGAMDQYEKLVSRLTQLGTS